MSDLDRAISDLERVQSRRARRWLYKGGSMSVSIDVLRAIVADYFRGPESSRELEIIRARFAGGEALEQINDDYAEVPVDVLAAICRRPDITG